LYKSYNIYDTEKIGQFGIGRIISKKLTSVKYIL